MFFADARNGILIIFVNVLFDLADFSLVKVYVFYVMCLPARCIGILLICTKNVRTDDGLSPKAFLCFWFHF